MRSLIGFLSPYVRSLELRVEEVTKERNALVERMVRLATGFGLTEDVPNAVEEQEKALELKEKALGVMASNRMRPDQIMREAEIASERVADPSGFDLVAEQEALDKELHPDKDETISPVTRILNVGAN